MYWCRSLARPTEPNWRWKIWNHVKADEYRCDNRMWKLCRSWPSFLQTIRCANCEVPLCNRKACWRHHVHAPLARSNTHAPPIARWCHRCFWFRTHNSTQKSLLMYLSLSIIDVMVLAFFCQNNRRTVSKEDQMGEYKYGQTPQIAHAYVDDISEDQKTLCLVGQNARVRDHGFILQRTA